MVLRLQKHKDKLNQFTKQLKSVFATKIRLKDIDLEQEIGNFLIRNIQNCSPLKIFIDHEEFISLQESPRY